MTITKEQLAEIQAALLFAGCFVHEDIFKKIDDVPAFRKTALSFLVAANKIVRKEDPVLTMKHSTFEKIGRLLPDDMMVSVIFPDEDDSKDIH
jgi:hypothetical protein